MKTVLLVDDSRTVQVAARLMLTGYRVITASDGEEGVQKAVAERPDLILLDVVMPRLDGFAALQQLRAHEALRAVPILMLSTRGEPENIERGYSSGCTEYLTKPLDGAELLARVRDFIGT